jgi:hypothetical protein
MSELTNILNGRANIKRFTANLVDKKATISIVAVDRQPPASCRLTVEVVGATILAGTVAIAGSTNETFNFGADGVTVGEKDFTSISGITIAGISNGFIEVRACSKTGQPINQEKAIYSNAPVRFYPVKMSNVVKMVGAGQLDIARHKFMIGPDYPDLQVNDRVYAVSGIAGLTQGEISFIEACMEFDGTTHHYEAEVSKL